MRIVFRLLALAVPLLPIAVQADEALSRRPSSEQIVERLSAPASAGKSRGWRGVKLEGQPLTESATAPSLDLEVNFEYASARLSPDAKIVLDNLGKALNAPALADIHINVVGHTDAKGGDQYNLHLSHERAAAVARYLAAYHAIVPTRLTVEGMGRSQLLLADDPYNALNRRVQVIKRSN